MSPLSALYGHVTQWRRAWYDGQPGRRRALACPVISVGNIASGGSGKTPVVAFLVRLLRDMGEHPAVLSRGYGRKRSADGVVVVSDGSGPLVPTDASGDEPQMLARALRGTPVLVSSDRALAGRLAERRFAVSVSLLDDGFQHVQLERDIDLVLVSLEDLEDRVIPFGRLREPLAAASRADAVIVPGPREEAERVAEVVGHARMFHVSTRYGAPRLLQPFGAPASATGRKVLAVAAIARPRRFFHALRAEGWEVVRELTYRDHHWFTPSDLRTIDAAARESGADVVVTTEKDAVRLDGAVHTNGASPWLFLPIEVAVEPLIDFREWLGGRLRAARASRRDRAGDLPRRSGEREGG